MKFHCKVNKKSRFPEGYRAALFLFFNKLYNTDQRNGYASLMFESDFGEHHNLSAGVSLNHDYYDQRSNF